MENLRRVYCPEAGDIVGTTMLLCQYCGAYDHEVLPEPTPEEIIPGFND